MPRNPKAEARRELEAAEANYRAAEKALRIVTERRKRAMVKAMAAGYTAAEVGHVCHVTRGHVSNVVVELRLKQADKRAS